MSVLDAGDARAQGALNGAGGVGVEGDIGVPICRDAGRGAQFTLFASQRKQTPVEGAEGAQAKVAAK
jgi:hypothetical protein